MDIKVIGNDLFLIKGFIHGKKLLYILEYFKKKDLLRKLGTNYLCWTYKLNYNDFSFIKQECNFILKLLYKVFSIKYKESNIGEFIKMGKGDFLKPHTDKHNTLQCVIYFNDILKINGGEFIYEDNIINPGIGDLVIFMGKKIHSVNTINSNDFRYCITFGFK